MGDWSIKEKQISLLSEALELLQTDNRTNRARARGIIGAVITSLN